MGEEKVGNKAGYNTCTLHNRHLFLIIIKGKYKKLNSFTMAEGRFNSPDLAKKAIKYGADSVTVGSAITRIENITKWFSKAVKK